MSGPRMSSLWKVSMHHCNFSKLLLPPLLSPLPTRVPLLPHANRTLRKRAWGHAASTQVSPFSLTKHPRAFYSENLPAQKEDLAGRLGIMDTPADGIKVNTPEESLVNEVEQMLGSPLGMGPQAPVQKPLVLVISGPSGVGKDAVINRLKEVRNDIHFVVTATTRAKRPGELDGKDYFFLTKREFESMIQKNELLEHAVVYGDLKGIPKRQVRDCLAKGFDVVLRVDVQGATTVRSILGSSGVFIFLVAESEAALVTRLVERKTETKDKLLVRIATAREELKRIKEFDYVVVNVDGQLERTVSLICHIIDAEKARVHQREANL